METKSPPLVVLPARMVPSFNVKEAFDRKVERKFLINTWGGLGDQVCAEPAIRYALKAFPQCEISLASRQPDLFTHLQFKEVFDTTLFKKNTSKPVKKSSKTKTKDATKTTKKKKIS